MISVYTLVVGTGVSSSYDDIIKNIDSGEYYNLMTIELMVNDSQYLTKLMYINIVLKNSDFLS